MPAPANGRGQRVREGTSDPRVGAAPGWRELPASRIGAWVGPVLVAAAGAVMLHWSWRTWPDILVDFGRELYVAWRLAEGDALYRDVAYFNGPLSPYLNSVWFRLFGTSLLTLALCNIALLACFVALLYRIFAEIADRFAATSACLGFVAIFAFGQLVGIGNYNFVCPYSHDATHGVMLAFLSLFCLWLHQGSGRLRYLAAAAAALGLVFLTKVEVFLAAAVAVAGHLVCLRHAARRSRCAQVRSWATFLGCLMAPPLLAFALLWLAMPLRSALEGILGPWRLIFDRELTSLAFYRGGMGLDDVAGNVEAMLVWVGWYGVVVGPAVVLGLVLRRAGLLRPVATVAYLLILGLAIGVRWQTIPWLQAARPLPLIALGLVAVFAALASVRRREPREGARATLALSLSLLALVLLAKMFLHARVYNYGFVLAMPSTLILVVALVSWLPALVVRLGGCGGAVRTAAVAVLVFAVAGHLHHVNVHFQRKTHRAGRGADMIKASRRGRAVQATIEQIERRSTPDETLAVLPEGVMLNYLTRRINPTPYINFMPPELIIFGEDTILDSLRGKPPDLIAIVHKDTSEYGYRFFGRDYGQSIMRWVRQNYHPLEVIDALPLRDRRFGILLLERGELP